VIGDAPRFDRIHISDVDHMLTPRALGLVLSNAPSLDVLGTRPDKPDYGQVGGSATVEYAPAVPRQRQEPRLRRRSVPRLRDLALAETADLRLREHSVWKSLPIDLYADAGIRIDTDIGVFELTISNATWTLAVRTAVAIAILLVAATLARADDEQPELQRMRFVERGEDLIVTA